LRRFFVDFVLILILLRIFDFLLVLNFRRILDLFGLWFCIESG
jgi:hypothetical protein